MPGERRKVVARAALAAALWLAGCSAAGGAPGDAGVEPEPLPEPGPRATCVLVAESSLRGVRLEFPEQPCAYTLEQVKAGVRFQYELVAEESLVTWVEGPGGGCAGRALTLGLALRPSVEGNGQRFCQCDSGPCGNPWSKRGEVPRGRHALDFWWNGTNWGGFSDFGAPYGPPFPAGRYAFQVSAAGLTEDGFPFSLRARLEFDLVP